MEEAILETEEMIDTIDSESIVNMDLDLSFGNEEIKDPRISEFIDSCVSVITVKEVPQDIKVDYAKLLNQLDKSYTEQYKRLSSIGIKRRKVNGSKFFKFLRDFKVVLSEMNEEERTQVLIFRLMCEKYNSLKKAEINNIVDSTILMFAKFANRFIDCIDPIAYTPKCKTMEDKSLQELYFSEQHLRKLVKIIVISKVTLIFTDCVHKDYRAEAKKLVAKKIWNTIFEPGDEKIDMKNKIHKLISSRFVSTIYNEKRFWAAAQFANINIISQANLIYNELQTDSILMLEFDKNPLSFLDVFLKNTIYYLSKRKFPLEFVLNNFDSQSAVMKSEITTEFKLKTLEESLMNRTIDDFIKRKINPIVSEEEIEMFSGKFTKNILHFWVVVPYMTRVLNISPHFLISLDKDRFLMLVLYTYYQLVKMKCYSMATLIKCNMEEVATGCYNEDVKNMSLIIARLLKNDLIKKFLERSEINSNVIDVSKVIANPLICMTMNKFKGLDNKEIKINAVEIIPEYMNFMDHYVKL